MDISDLGVVVPINSGPNNSDYYQVASVAMRYPRVKILALLDLPTDTVNHELNNMIGILANAGVKVIARWQQTYDSADDFYKAKAIKTFYPKVSGIAIDVINEDVMAVKDRIDLVRDGYEIVILSFDTLDTEGRHHIPAVLEATIDWPKQFIENIGFDKIDLVTHTLNGIPAGIFENVDVLNHDWIRDKFETPRARASKFAYTFRLSNINEVREWRKLMGAAYATNASRWMYIEDTRYINGLSWSLESSVKEMDKYAEAEGKQIPYETTQKTGYNLTPNPVGQPGGGAENPGGAMGGPSGKDVAIGKGELYDVEPNGTHVKMLYPDVADDTKYFNYHHSGKDLATKELGKPWALTNQFKWGFSNVEITTYVKLTDTKKNTRINSQTPLYTIGVYSKSKTGYEVSIKYGGYTSINKIVDGVYGQQRVATGTNQEIQDKWLGIKAVYLQYSEEDGDKQQVARIELYLDEHCTLPDGKLHVDNNWRAVQRTHDYNSWASPQGEEKKRPKDFDKAITGKMDATMFVVDKNAKALVASHSIRSIEPVIGD